ncbi:Protein of unknown function [Pyronema omphalodes CBS 100304]|uniref:Uncharacterized protein n=1 Tax=Pyronema omphalodes (strain CBS 100304) TaxID=1076935 RepID=U4LC39_PYROM|nr:Protein of unknown function [Pyronema omphalodes CBS 100304]
MPSGRYESRERAKQHPFPASKHSFDSTPTLSITLRYAEDLSNENSVRYGGSLRLLECNVFWNVKSNILNTDIF